MGKKEHGGDFRRELEELWGAVEFPPLDGFLKEVDESLYRAFDQDASGIYWLMFEFFDSDPNNPLTPRELLEFDAALTEEERLFILLELC